MLSLIKYPLVLKYWVIYFLQKIKTFPFNLKVKVYSKKILLYIAVYTSKFNKISNLTDTYLLSDNLKCKILQIYLQQSMPKHFPKKLSVYFNNISNHLYNQRKLRSQHIYLLLKNQKSLKFNLVDFINVVNICLFFKTPYILVKYFSNLLSLVKKHRVLIFLFRKLVKECLHIYRNLSGLKLKVSGKINGASRTRQIVLLEGKVPLSSKSSGIYYAFTNAMTFTGVFGVKLWFHF